MIASLVIALLTTSALSIPTQEADRSCSAEPIWSLSNIEYYSHIIYSTPAHPAIHATISFNVTNTETKDTTHCAAHSHEFPEFFYGRNVYKCDNPAGAGTNPKEVTSFSFSKSNSSLVVNQSWACGSTNTVRNMTAESPVQLSCDTQKYKNPNWKAGETYESTKVICQPSSLKLTPLQIAN
ncbi:hypothetical protein BT63DRAFT_188706 [Microthyrium microscopicum]|uniref:AA1-like domain-containing protein n=1 Tax=Microthyrium microscopicum TaxID=703497 RepID=A0A6A6UKY7_9PEZI|nr:hypothetical protein BT63DRAFT_188706 [Microthyrium microscopicum]